MLSGSYVALVTPFTNGGEVDFVNLESLVNFHLENKTDGLVILGTTGEAATLSDNERDKIIKQVVGQVAGEISVIVGTGHNSTKQAIELTEGAYKLGADAALVVTPYYNKPDQDGLRAHYNAIASSTNIPIVLYNVPGRTACDMLPDTVAELATNSNIVGLKEAVNTTERFKELVSLCPEGFALLSGDDGTFVDFLKCGGHGTISVSCNVVPATIADICHAARDNNWDLAEELNKNLSDLHDKLFINSNPIPVKWALYHMGKISSPECRLPLQALAQKYQQPVMTALKTAGIL